MLLIFGQFNTFAQTGNKTDSIYYLLDTAKTPVTDRMWDIHVDKGSIFGNDKSYVIQCPCLKDGGKPTFFYASGDRGEGMLVNKKQLKTLKAISLSALIAKAKQVEGYDYKIGIRFNQDTSIILE